MRNRDLQVPKLIEYAVRLKTGAVRRRLGYLLELYGLATPDQIEPLRGDFTRTYNALDPPCRRKARISAAGVCG